MPWVRATKNPNSQALLYGNTPVGTPETSEQAFGSDLFWQEPSGAFLPGADPREMREAAYWNAEGQQGGGNVYTDQYGNVSNPPWWDMIKNDPLIGGRNYADIHDINTNPQLAALTSDAITQWGKSVGWSSDTNFGEFVGDLAKFFGPTIGAGLGLAALGGTLGGAAPAAGWTSGYDLPGGGAFGGVGGTSATAAAPGSSYWNMLAGEAPEGGISGLGDVVGSDWASGLESAMSAGDLGAGGAAIGGADPALGGYGATLGGSSIAGGVPGAYSAAIPANLELLSKLTAAGLSASQAASVAEQAAKGLLPQGAQNALSDILKGIAVPAALSVLSGALGAGAAGNAADAQQRAVEQGIAEQRRQYDLSRADQAPFRETGVAGNARLRGLLGLGGADVRDDAGYLTRNFTLADRDADPVYQSGLQFGLDEGRNAINARAVAGGGYDSGATLKALTRYGTDYGSTKANESYGRFNVNRDSLYNKLAGISGAGQVATNQVQSAGQNMANNVSGLYGQGGDARSAGIVGGAQAWGGALEGINNAFGNYQSNQRLDALLAEERAARARRGY